MSDPLRVAVLPDFREEGWPSMDRVADELLRHLARDHHMHVDAMAVRPPFQRRATRVAPGSLSVKIDRGLNRFLDYPRHLSAWTRQFDVFHVVDHSYAQLVHRLPAERTVVTCHDLDTFRSVLRPCDTRRSWAFRAMTRRVLDGLRRAAFVTCDTSAVRDELVREAGLSAARVGVVPVGVTDVFTAKSDAVADRVADTHLGPRDAALEVLHVGGVAARKRIDVLLASVAAAGPRVPRVRLIHVGEPFAPDHVELIRTLGIEDRVRSLAAVDDRVLAAIYRRAALVLVPSEREGFGLPVVEGLASGTPVVASDIPVLREVGGSTTSFCAVGDVRAWTESLVTLLEERDQQPQSWAMRRDDGVRWAARFSWAGFARALVGIYQDLARTSGLPHRRESLACPA